MSVPATFSPEEFPDVRGIASPLGSLPASSHVGRVRLAVTDLMESLRFYRDVAGLRLLRGPGRKVSESPLARLGTASGTVLLELEELAGAKRISHRTRLGLYHTALLLPSRADLGNFVQHLDRLRYPYGSSDHLVSEALYLVDPDGLTLEVYADRPRSEWEYRDGLLVSGVFPFDKADVVKSSSAVWRGVPDLTIMGHIHFYVADLVRSSRFYHEAMGLDIAMSVPGALFVSAGGYHHQVGYNVFAASSPTASGEDARVLSWELVLPDEAVVAEIATRLRSVATEGETQLDGQPSFTDPDGIRVVLRASSRPTKSTTI